MRPLIALFVCSLVVTTAIAADPPAATLSATPPAAAPAPTSSIKPVLDSIRPKSAPAPAPAPSAAAIRAQEEQAEAELSAKIAARLTLLRAAQAARATQAAKARKEAAAAAAAQTTVAAHKAAHGTHWSYEGETGPANWGKINVDWAKCGNGNRQSPIDIRDGMKVELEQISFDYKPTSFTVTDNGKTVQVTMGGGNYITIQNRMYELMQFHFHRPSEERIGGRGFEMVVHLVHRDAENKLGVIAVLIERGKPHGAMQTVWNNLPLEKLESVSPSILLDPSDLLPQRREYFTYMGSLTTPPCTEGVLWMVMKEPAQATANQMALFSRLYPLNARPIQASSGRMIKESN